MDNRRWDGNIEVIEIYAKDLEEAKKAMTGKWIGFRSRVTDVISNGERALVTVETCGRLPFVRRRWDRFRVPAEQRKAIGVDALVYKMGKHAEYAKQKEECLQAKRRRPSKET